MKTIARTEYDDRPVFASDLSCEGDKGVTKQSDLKDSDLNIIFKKYERTGQLPDLILKNGRYGDFSAVPDYQEAVNIVKTANEQFAALDVVVRNQFENDPAKFLAFVTDPKNIDEVEKLGLLKPEAVAIRKANREAAIAANIAAENAAKAQAEKDLIAKIKAAL